MAEPGFVAEAPANRLAGRVELAGLDTDNLAASLADQVLALALAEERVEAGTMAEVNMPNDAHRLEPLEVAVDRGEVEGGAAVGQPLGDPLSRHRRVSGEELEAMTSESCAHRAAEYELMRTPKMRDYCESLGIKLTGYREIRDRLRANIGAAAK